ncbi:transmembrane signal receptor [Lithospermum erythrorhizon]|uniref:Transmembrane signal receptor n=1 Tax=Lithospermum erythrorhizon TaxID=34254 RepID=A0AAV3P4M3_LITER
MNLKPSLKHDKDGEERVMQFLLGLNDEYEAIGNQILLMDPLPSVSKYKSMVVNMEKQRQVQHFAHEVEVGKAMKHGSNGADSSHAVHFTNFSVKSIGIVKLPANLKLVDYLYVPSFKSNLLFVSKIVKTSSVRFSFFVNHYQDFDSQKVLALAREAKGLYLLDFNSFNEQTISNTEPYLFKQANGSVEWRQAIQEEIAILEKNHTWEVVDLPTGHNPIGCKWIYKVKCKKDGSVERLKAKFVAKGYNQIDGVDYFDSFSHVAKMVTVKILLTMTAAKGEEVLHDAFTIKDLGIAKFFLGIEIARLEKGMHLSQQKLSSPTCPTQYRRLVGRLLYLNFTRPDLTFSVHHLSQFMRAPSVHHWEAALHIVKYLKGFITHGLYYPANTNFQLEA